MKFSLSSFLFTALLILYPGLVPGLAMANEPLHSQRRLGLGDECSISLDCNQGDITDQVCNSGRCFQQNTCTVGNYDCESTVTPYESRQCDNFPTGRCAFTCGPINGPSEACLQMGELLNYCLDWSCISNQIEEPIPSTEVKGACTWVKTEMKEAIGFAEPAQTVYTLALAKAKCVELTDSACKAITCDIADLDSCTLRNPLPGMIVADPNFVTFVPDGDIFTSADCVALDLRWNIGAVTASNVGSDYSF